MPRFVILEHDTTQPVCPPPPDRDVHWDLIIETPGAERCPTWRLLRDPTHAQEQITAERIQDHRPLYLEYEGEVSGNRGFVRQVDRGQVTIAELTGDSLHATFAGEHVRGAYEIARGQGGRLVFRRAY